MELTIRSSLSAYLRAGKLLHSITVMEVFLGFVLISWLNKFPASSLPGEVFRIYTIVFVASLPVFAQLDARSRYQNYKQVRDQFFIYGFDARIIKPLIKSRCQRDAAMLAANDTGYKMQCSRLFRSSGYRWYHLFPDFVFSHPGFLFTGYFWKTTFFCSTYRVKYFGKNDLTVNKELQFLFARHG